MAEFESQSGPGSESTRRQWSRRELVAAGAGALLFVGVGGFILGVKAESSRSAPKEVTMEEVRATAQNLGHQCVEATANGTITRFGPEDHRTTVRSFPNGTRCRVVVQNGKIVDMKILESSPPSRNSGPTTYEIRQQTNQTGDPVLHFEEKVASSGISNIPGNVVAGVAIDGFANRDGQSRTYFAGLHYDDKNPYGLIQTSLLNSGPSHNPENSGEVFNNFEADAKAALNNAIRQ